MTDLPMLILGVLASLFKSRAKLEAEILVLRQQINVLRRRARKRPHLNNTDRFLFVWLYHWFPSVLGAIAIVRPETIIRWHRAGFRAYWRWRSRNHAGRPKVSAELRTLIGEMSRANPLWGAPHIHGELLKLGFEIAQSTVARYYVPQQVATVSGLAHVSEQPCRGHRSDRPFCPSNDRVPDPLLSCHYTAWATNFAVVQRNGKPDCGVDLAPDHRGFPMGSGRRDISFGIGTLRMGQSSCSVCAPWVFETGRFHSDHPGKTLTLRGSLVRSAGSA